MSNDEATALYPTEAEIAAGRAAAKRHAQSTNGQGPSIEAPPGEREVLILRGLGDAGDTQRIAEGLARRLVMRLFSLEDRLHILDDGKLIPVSAHLLRTIFGQTFASLQLVSRAGRLQAELCPIELGHQVVLDVLAATNQRVLKVTIARALSPQLCSEAVSRIRMGEARVSVCKAYFGEANSTTLAELKRIEEAAGPRW